MNKSDRRRTAGKPAFGSVLNERPFDSPFIFPQDPQGLLVCLKAGLPVITFPFT